MTKTMHRSAFAALAGVFLLSGSLTSAFADNRFGDGVGGAMGGTGSLGEGSVTVHHNLLPAERQEIDMELEELHGLIASLRQENNALKTDLQEIKTGIGI